MALKKNFGFSKMLLWATLAVLPVGVAITLFDAARVEAVTEEAGFALPDAVAAGTKVRIDGSESMSAVNQSLKQKYEGQFSGTAVEVGAGGTDAALKRLAAGEIDVASIGRLLTEDEEGQGLTPVILDREKIAIVVSEENPFSGDIGYAQFAQLFRGEIKDWSELGGNAGAIRFIDRPDTSDTRQSFKTYPVFEGTEFKAGGTAEPLSADDTAALISALGKDGVGYALYSQVKDLPGLKVLPMHKVLPDNPAYPYSQPRVLVYKGDPNEAVQSFLGLATNEPGAAAVEAAEAAEAKAVAAGKSPATAAQSFSAGDAASGDAAQPDAATPDAATTSDAAEGGDDAKAGDADAANAEAGDAEANDAKASDAEASDAEGDATAGEAAEGEAGADASADKPADGAGDAPETTAEVPADGVADAGVEGAGDASVDAGDAGAADGGADGGADIVADAGGVAGESRGGLPRLWGLLPLAALAAGGGLLWWLAAGAGDDEDDFDADTSRAATGAVGNAASADASDSATTNVGGSMTLPPMQAAAKGAAAAGAVGAAAGAAASDQADAAVRDASASVADASTAPSGTENTGMGAVAAGGAAVAAAGAAAIAAGSAQANSAPSEGSIESVLTENRLFYPSESFSQAAHVKGQDDYNELYVKAKADPAAFWDDLAKQELEWFEPWEKTLEWNPPEAKWFTKGKLNITHNCLDRHLTEERRNKPAIIWEGEPGDSRVLTYAQLHREVCLFANSLKKLGVGKGDVVGIYMPMIPEAAIAMLACARIGAPHSVVFGGFSAEALRDRLNDGKAKLVITADGGWRKDSIVELKTQVDKAIDDNAAPTVDNVLVVQRTRQDIPMQEGRDHWWHDLRQQVSPDCPAEPMDSEDVLFILYTSGSTGKPKGVVHTTGGYNLYTHMTTKWIFDLKEDDVYWCTADVGWITGHSYIVYGPLSNGATSLMYEGAPRKSNPGCFWDVVEKYKVSIFYTAPTAIRAFIKMGEDLPKARDLSSLRLLGTVGEPINPEAWMWYHRVIGGERCPIVDTWWQTETGGVMITALPGAIPTKPGSATKPFPGIMADVVDMQGNPVPQGEGGYLVIRHPWPSMLRTVYGDAERFRKTYWEQIPGDPVYFAGDGARIDDDGYFWVMGRVDDVISVSGHRLGTMEIESALVSHPAVAEAAVVGRPDDLKGEEVFAFVTLEGGQSESEELVQGIKAHVVQEIGALARPADIRFTDALPKTRSGKIMRRLLRKVAAGDEISGDTSTLEDRSVLDKLRSGE